MPYQKTEQIITLINHLSQLDRSLLGKWSKRDFQRNRLFGRIRRDARQLLQDPNFDRYVPSSGLLLSADELKDRISFLDSYLREYVRVHYPGIRIVRQTEAGKTDELKRQIDHLEYYNADLQAELRSATQTSDHLKKQLAALQTPAQFEIPEDVMDKLTPLERVRLQETVLAYRVGAWTPAAAVCGMILEGRLQELCRDSSIRQGTIRQMIQRLGEAGLLEGYYQDLVRIGEFFRHRAAHPTSENFDREKTTLILTSLVILIRHIF